MGVMYQLDPRNKMTGDEEPSANSSLIRPNKAFHTMFFGVILKTRASFTNCLASSRILMGVKALLSNR